MKYKSMMVFRYIQMSREAMKYLNSCAFPDQYNEWYVDFIPDDPVTKWLLENGANSGEEVLIKLY